MLTPPDEIHDWFSNDVFSLRSWFSTKYFTQLENPNKDWFDLYSQCSNFHTQVEVFKKIELALLFRKQTPKISAYDLSIFNRAPTSWFTHLRSLMKEQDAKSVYLEDYSSEIEKLGKMSPTLQLTPIQTSPPRELIISPPAPPTRVFTPDNEVPDRISDETSQTVEQKLSRIQRFCSFVAKFFSAFLMSFPPYPLR